jgi:hypothetical protein
MGCSLPSGGRVTAADSRPLRSPSTSGVCQLLEHQRTPSNGARWVGGSSGRAVASIPPWCAISPCAISPCWPAPPTRVSTWPRLSAAHGAAPC